MARDIEATPVIRGKDALRFYEQLEEDRNKKVDVSVLQRIQQSVDYLKKYTLRSDEQYPRSKD